MRGHSVVFVGAAHKIFAQEIGKLIVNSAEEYFPDT